MFDNNYVVASTEKLHDLIECASAEELKESLLKLTKQGNELKNQEYAAYQKLVFKALFPNLNIV